MLITVSKSVDEGFSSLQEALDSIPQEHKEEVTIRIKPGIYEEKITVKQGTPPVLLLGEDTNSTIITWSDNAHTLGPDGEPLGTFKSGTLNVFAEHFTAENLTIRNASGPGTGQAVAAFVDAGHAVFRRVRLLGDQDTLYTGQGSNIITNATLKAMWIIFLARLRRCLNVAGCITSVPEDILPPHQRLKAHHLVMYSSIVKLLAVKV